MPYLEMSNPFEELLSFRTPSGARVVDVGELQLDQHLPDDLTEGRGLHGASGFHQTKTTPLRFTYAETTPLRFSYAETTLFRFSYRKTVPLQTARFPGPHVAFRWRVIL